MKCLFTLICLFCFFTSTSSQVPDVWINEFHYDNSSTDYHEGVEIAGLAGTNISGYLISFYNGSDSSVYKTYTIPISSYIFNNGSGLGALWFDIPRLQNGPDGIALSRETGELIQFISYEGSFMAKDGPAIDSISEDVLVREGAATDSSFSIQLTGEGTSYKDFLWQADLPRTHGKANTNQQLGPIPDTLAPMFAMDFPVLATVRYDQAAFELKLDEPACVFYKVQLASAGLPTFEEIKQADSIYCEDSSQVNYLLIDTLQDNTDYTVFFLARDTMAAPNFQDTLTTINFSTPLFQEINIFFPTNPDTCYLGDSLEIIWESMHVNQVQVLAQAYFGLEWSILLDTLIEGAQNSFQYYLSPDLETDSIQIIIVDSDNLLIADTSGTIMLVDTLGATVTNMFPVNGSKGIKLLDSFRIEFNEPVQLNDSGSIQLCFKEDSSLVEDFHAGGKISIQGNSLVFFPDSILQGGKEYFILLSEGLVSDTDGNAFAGISDINSWKFTTQQPGLFFSEYLEGSGYNKAIELYNSTDSLIDLSEFVIKRSSNGEGWVDSLILEVVLEPQTAFVIAHSSADSVIRVRSDLLSSFASHNGNDAYGLLKNGELEDIIGNPFENPGEGWNVAGVEAATKDYTLLRKKEVFAGNSDWQVSFGTNRANSEWEIFPKDFLTNLGKPTCKPDTNTIPISVSVPGYSIDSASVIFPENDSIVITLIQSARTDSLIPQFELPSGARVYPENGEAIDFSSGSASFTVTAEDMQTQQLWNVFIHQLDHQVSGHDILEVGFAGMMGEVGIDTSVHIVSSTIAYTTSISDIQFDLHLSPGAVYTILDNVNDTVFIEVIAEDSSAVIWKLILYREEPLNCSISEIQRNRDEKGNSLLVGQLVRIHGTVTGIDKYGFYLQDADSVWSGLYIYSDGLAELGDSLSVVGVVDEWIYKTEISPVYDIGILATERDLPNPIVGTVAELKEEAAENLLVTLEHVQCIVWNESIGITEVTDGKDTIRIIVDTLVDQIDLQNYYSITGIATSEFGMHIILPQRFQDIIDLGLLQPSSDAALNSIWINGKALEGFNPAVLNYEDALENGLESWPDITCEPSDSNAKVEIIGCAKPIQDGETCTVVVRVLAEDGSTSCEYSVILVPAVSAVVEEKAPLLFYPNPVKDKLFVSRTFIDQRLCIYDLAGRLILSIDNMQQSPSFVDVSGLKPGVYIVQLQMGGQKVFHHIIKE